MAHHVYYGLIFTIFLNMAYGLENKYSKELNAKETPDVNFRTLLKPFRMAKLNLLWSKAQQRLTETKLQSLFSELKLLDKEELTWKRVKSESGDKDGLLEASLRKKLMGVMSNYNLMQHFDDVQDKEKVKTHAYSAPSDPKNIFKDKKLNYLWQKAETSGFTPDELDALREEFQHQQDKIEQYYALLDDVNEGKKDGHQNAVDDEEHDTFNTLDSRLETNEINKDYIHKTNLIRDKHHQIRDSYDRLQRTIALGPDNRDFVEPKVQGLWRIAVESNFTPNELDSLKVELQHYEARLLKLRHLHAEQVSNHDQYKSKVAATGDKLDHFDETQQMIKKHALKVDKLHQTLENKILSRHSEL